MQTWDYSHSFGEHDKLFNSIGSINLIPSGDELWSAPAILMAIGAIVFIIAFLGCCGAIKESSCMVLTVSAFLTNKLIPSITFTTKRTFAKFRFFSVLNLVLTFVDRNHSVWNWYWSIWLCQQGRIECCFGQRFQQDSSQLRAQPWSMGHGSIWSMELIETQIKH